MTAHPGCGKMQTDTMKIDEALLDRILPQVSKPARYTGGEWNSVVKDWGQVEVKIALAYPETYEVGMSNLGLMILYDILNRQENLLAERVYAPWIDLEEAMREAGLPLFSLESRRPLSDFDIIGFSLPYELNYTNVLNMLDLAGLPLLASERNALSAQALVSEGVPLIIGGGSMTYNAEPLADFFDLFVIGEGEEVLLELVAAYREATIKGPGTRDSFLRQAARIEGVYVPGFYAVTYRGDGTVAEVRPTVPEAPRQVVKRIVPTLPPPPIDLIVPYIDVVHDRAMIEIQRGCTQGCRYCQAGMIYRPLRERPLDEVLAASEAILKSTGYEEIALVSLSSTDYSQIEALVRELMARYKTPPVSVSLPSLRLDSFSVTLAEMIQERRKTGLTFAPEAGSQRLRDVINKKLTDEDLLRTTEAAYGSGWRRIKLYFMIGLPTETMEDVAAIVDLVREVRAVGRRIHGRRAQVNVSVATFIPKPHTPFQWLPLLDEARLQERLSRLREGLRGGGVHFSWHDPETSFLEAILARGDRRLGRVIRRAWELGARFDAWSETFEAGRWHRALAEVGLDPNFYAYRQRPFGEVWPWDHIDVGVRPAFLWAEYERSLRGQVSVDCRERCLYCGVQKTFQACRSGVTKKLKQSIITSEDQDQGG